LDKARGDIFLPVDSDNVPLPWMISRFAEAMVARPDVTALSSYFGAFDESADPLTRNVNFVYMPSGGPSSIAPLLNVLGDANSAFRIEWIKANRYSEDRSIGTHDWDLFVRLVHQGAKLDVIPEILLMYRTRSDSMIRTSSRDAESNHMARTMSAILRSNGDHELERTMIMISQYHFGARRMQELEDSLHSAHIHLDETGRYRNALQGELDQLRGRLEEIVNSRSWRLTAPLRKIYDTLAHGLKK